MSRFVFLFLSCCLIAISQLQSGAEGIVYTVTDRAAGTPGGDRFAKQVGTDYSLQTLGAATNFILSTFQQGNAADRKDVQRVNLIVETMEGVAYTSNNEIHLSAGYVRGISGDAKKEIAGVLYHEMTHVWQWNGGGKTPGGLIEGIADFVRLKAGYAPEHWVGPGGGNKWDEGYAVTARFLDYCEGLKSGFVAELNKKMRSAYSGNYFVELLGKSVDQLWADYKKKYAK